MFGIKYNPRSAFLNLILLFSARARIRLITFIPMVAAMANLNVNR